MLIQLTAEIVKRITVNLEFVDDVEGTSSVELREGNIYKIKYEKEIDEACCCNRTKTLSVSNAMLVKIAQLLDKAYKTGPGIVRENVGMYDSVYSCNCHNGVSESEYAHDPQVNEIRLTFMNLSTNEYFYVMLDEIRACSVVVDSANEDGEPDPEVEQWTRIGKIAPKVLPVATEGYCGAIKASPSIVVDEDGTAHTNPEFTEDDFCTTEQVNDMIRFVFDNEESESEDTDDNFYVGG